MKEGMQLAQVACMARRPTFALALAAAMSMLLRAATGCSTSHNPAGAQGAGEDATANDAGANSDAGEGGFVPNGCNAGCLCYGVDACPAGCYPSVTEGADGSGSEPFCSNGIVQCVAGGFSWSLGVPANNCPGGPSTYLDSGPAPDGSFCCDYHQDAGSAPACTVGSACSQTEVCTGGVAGCPDGSAYCQAQCLNGTWQAPCPLNLPESGSACTAAGAYCGYSNQPNPCGADNCYCQGGAWSCGPTCIFEAGTTDAPAGD
jgi:hypothetical protein